MADLDIGGSGGIGGIPTRYVIGGSGGIGGIPTRYVIIGAGVLGVGAILLMQRRGGSGGATDQTYGASLGPNAALALGSLETRLAQESGNLQLLMRDYRDELGEQLDAAAAGLGDSFAGGVGRLSGELAKAGEAEAAYFNHLANIGQQNQDLIRYFGWKMPGAIPDAVAFPNGYAAAAEASRHQG